jgi:hypothetical protein
MQRNLTNSHALTTHGRFGAISRPNRPATYQPHTRAISRPATQQQTERPSLFASLCHCLLGARRDQPVGGDESPLVWW